MNDDIKECYELALEICNPLRAYASPLVFKAMVYNLAAHYVVTNSQAMGEPFSTLYQKYKVGDFGGFVASASNDKTAVGYATPKSVTEGDMSDYDYMSTPYGRNYLSYIEQVTPLVVG